MIKDLITENTNVSITMTEAQLEAYSVNLINMVLEAKQTPKEELLTKKEAIDYLKVSGQTLWRWEKAGYLVPVRLGDKIMYRVDDLKNIAR